MDLFDLVAKITMDSSDYIKGISDAKNLASGLSSGLGTAIKVGTAAVGAVTAVAGAVSAAAVGTANYGSEVNDMSKKIGMSAQAYQQWNYVMKLNGTSVENLKMGMKTLSSQAESGSDAFQKLGISQGEVASMNQEQLFSRVIDGLSGMEASTERTTLATTLLGRSGADLGALLDEGTDKINEEKQAALDLGMVMSDEAVAASDDFGDTLDTVKMALGGVKNMVMADFLPSMTTAMKGFIMLLAGKDGGMEMITEGINGFMQKIAEVAPKVLEAGGKIVGALVMGIVTQLPSLINTAVTVINTLVQDIMANAPAIIDAVVAIISALVNGIVTLLPTIVQAGVELLVALINGLTQALPQLIAMLPTVITLIIQTLLYHLGEIIDAGLELLIALIQGLVQALPQLIDMLPMIIDTIVDTLTDNLPYIVEAGVEILVMLAVGIIRAIPQLISKLPEIFDHMNQAFNDMDWGSVGSDIMNGIGDALSGLASDAWNWGSDMIDNFIGGITNKWNDLKNSVSNIAQTVANFLGFSEPKEGPLSRFHTYAPDMMELFAKGIADNEGMVTGQISKSFNFGDAITAPTTSPLALATAGGGVNINIYPPEGTDVEAIARAVKQEFITAIGIDGAAYGN